MTVITAVGAMASLAACAGSSDSTGASIDLTSPSTNAEITVESITVESVPVDSTVDSTTAPETTTTIAARATTTPVSTVPGTSVPLVEPDGFEAVAATVTTADGEVCELCLWLAASQRDRSRGLMGVTDLGRGDGMAFVYDGPNTGSFWMKNTLLPLSIAFFGEDGTFLDAFDMEPCAADPCPLYPTAPDFLVAIEVVEGDLPDLGIAEGSVLRLTDLPCP